MLAHVIWINPLKADTLSASILFETNKIEMPLVYILMDIFEEKVIMSCKSHQNEMKEWC